MASSINHKNYSALVYFRVFIPAGVSDDLKSHFVLICTQIISYKKDVSFVCIVYSLVFNVWSHNCSKPKTKIDFIPLSADHMASNERYRCIKKCDLIQFFLFSRL